MSYLIPQKRTDKADVDMFVAAVKRAKDLHECALVLGEIPGRERDCNTVSKEAARADAEVAQLKKGNEQ